MMDTDYDLLTAMLWNVRVDHLWMNFGYSEEPSFQSIHYPDVFEGFPRLLFPYMPQIQGFHMLDVGFGYGDQSNMFNLHFSCQYTGINISPNQLRVASARFPTLDLREMSATNLRFAPETFDVVTSIDSAHHYDTREDFIKEAFRVLKPGGRLMLIDIVNSDHSKDIMQYPDFSQDDYKKRWTDLFLQGGGPEATIASLVARRPKANDYNASVYKHKARAIGFQVQLFTDISEHVAFWPNKRWFNSSPLSAPHIPVIDHVHSALWGNLHQQVSAKLVEEAVRMMSRVSAPDVAGLSAAVYVLFPIFWALSNFVVVVLEKPDGESHT